MCQLKSLLKFWYLCIAIWKRCNINCNGIVQALAISNRKCAAVDIAKQSPCSVFKCPYGQVNVKEERRKKTFNSAFYVWCSQWKGILVGLWIFFLSYIKLYFFPSKTLVGCSDYTYSKKTLLFMDGCNSEKLILSMHKLMTVCEQVTLLN